MCSQLRSYAYCFFQAVRNCGRFARTRVPDESSPDEKQHSTTRLIGDAFS